MILTAAYDSYVFGSAFSTQHFDTNQLISCGLGVSAKKNGVDWYHSALPFTHFSLETR